MTDTVIPVTDELLRSIPLPHHSQGEDKDERGRVLVIGGSVETPGGALLAGLAALRAGAGKLQIATCRSVAPALAVAVPEAGVTGLGETPDGAVCASEAERLAGRCGRTDVVLLGPGMQPGDAASRLTRRLLEQAAGPCFVLDAAALHALDACRDVLGGHAGRI